MAMPSTDAVTLPRGSRLRNAGVALTSALVMSVLAVFAVAPAQAAMAAEVRKSKTFTKGETELVYGEVLDKKGRPVAKARVVLYHFVEGRLVVDRIVFTDAKGLYREKVDLTEGRRYSVQITATVNDKFVKSRVIKFKVEDGQSIEVSGKLVSRGVFTFVPIVTY